MSLVAMLEVPYVEGAPGGGAAVAPQMTR